MTLPLFKAKLGPRRITKSEFKPIIRYSDVTTDGNALNSDPSRPREPKISLLVESNLADFAIKTNGISSVRMSPDITVSDEACLFDFHDVSLL